MPPIHPTFGRHFFPQNEGRKKTTPATRSPSLLVGLGAVTGGWGAVVREEHLTN